MADSTRIRIVGTDEASSAFRQVTSSADRLNQSLANMVKQLAGVLGVGLSVGYFAALIKGSIDAMDHLNDLNKSTGLTVETLAGLRLLASQTGTDLDGLAKGMNKMSVEMGKNPEAFKALGITAKDSVGALKQFADLFNNLEDINQRNALAQKVFNKSWAELAPALSEGGKRIGEIIEKGAKMSGVTSENVKQADELNDKWAELGGNGGVLIRVVGPLLPLMNELADSFLKAREESNQLGVSFSPLLEVMKVLIVLGSDVSFVFTTIGKDIARAIENVQLIAKGDFAGSRALGAMFKKDAEEARAALDAFQKRIMALGTTSAATTPQVAALTGAKNGAAAAAAAAAKKFLEEGKAAADLDAAYRGLLKGLKEKLLAEHEQTEVAKLQLALDALSPKARAAITAAQEKELKSLAALIDAKKLQAAIDESDLKIAKLLADQKDKHAEAIQNEADAALRRFQSANANINSIKNETALMRLSNNEREIAVELLRLEEMGIKKGSAAYEFFAGRLRTVIAEQQALREQQAMWNEAIDLAGRFFTDLVINGKSAFDNLKKMLKSFLADLISIFARRWILNLVGQGSLAGQVGQGTLAGAVSSWFGNTVLGSAITGGASAFAAGWQGASLGAGLAGPTTVGAGGLMGFGATIANAIAAIPVWGWIAAGLLAVAAAFLKNDDKWRATLGFGANAQVYATEGVFGREGFRSIEGNDAVNRAIQDFFASTRPLDESIARHLTPEQISTITGNLAIYNRRTDGQAAEFAFDRREEGAAEQLTLEYLKHKYGTVFDQIDETFAKFIREYAGKSEDLLKEIGAFVMIMDQLSAMGMPGLDIGTLRLMQRNGEQIGDTFQRVGTLWSNFTELFTTDAERLTMAQEAINTTFATLGIAVPTTKDEFEALVRGLDLTTESGRTMFQALLTIAPAFAAVADAAAAAAQEITDRWEQVVENIRRMNGVTDFDFAVSRFQSANPQFAGLSGQELARVLATITEDDFRRYTPEMQRFIVAITGAADAADDAADALNTIWKSPWHDAAMGRQAVMDAKAPLGPFLDGLLTDDLSPLDPQAKFSEAGKKFWDAIAAAKGGDITAIESLPRLAQDYLGFGRDMFASSSDYVKLFTDVFDAVSGIAGVPNFNERMLASSEKTTEYGMKSYEVQAGMAFTLTEVLDVLMDIRDRAPATVRPTVEAERR